MMRILLVEDDALLRRSLTAALRARDLAVSDCPDGRSALRQATARTFDVVLLDLGLPDIDGITLLPQLRRAHDGPIIVLSARRDQSDKVTALDAGADDYMTKPFGLGELLARIRAQARRAGQDSVVTTAAFSIDLARQTVLDARGEPVSLTATEWAVLAALTEARGAPLTSEELLARVWGTASAQRGNLVRVYVNLLRRKLEPEPSAPRSILTLPGRGYALAIAAGRPHR